MTTHIPAPLQMARPRANSAPGGPRRPEGRGDLSEALLEVLTGRPAGSGSGAGRGSPAHRLSAIPPDGQGEDGLHDEDLQLALYLCYELHYRGLAGVDPEWEWDPEVIRFRSGLERAFEAALASVAERTARAVDAKAELLAMAGSGSGPSLSGHMAERGTLAEMRELAVHRSAYQLKEADPHTWAIPRLSGRAKAAMVEIQSDEYGEGREAEMHSVLFADTMRELGLDPTYGAYLDQIPAITLATVNLVSMLGLHRRWRGALVGHLALFEMTSVGPMGRYSLALERLGLGIRARRFYDAHVLADAHHEQVALHQMVDGLIEAEPDLAADVVTGARWLTAVEGAFTAHVLDSWSGGRSSLRMTGPARPIDARCGAGGGSRREAAISSVA